MRTIKYTFSNFEKDFKYILQKCKELRIGTIVAIARGGLLLGTKLSNVLNIPMSIVFFKSYKGKTRSDSLFTVTLLQPFKNPILLVDDIADSGLTLITVKKWFENYNIKTATIFLKRRSVIKPDIYVREVENNTWIKFPWE